MSAGENTPAGESGPPRAAASPGGGHRLLGHGRRSRTAVAPHGPDVAAMAREAVISFLNDASRATAEREAARTEAASTEAGEAPEPLPPDAIPPVSHAAASHAAPGSVAWRAATALDRIEAVAAKVEADIAVAHRAYAELQAGAGAAAEAAVRAAESAMSSAGVAVEAERQVRISLRQVRQNVVISVVLLIVIIIILEVISSPVR
jgi:hypothetical protein